MKLETLLDNFKNNRLNIGRANAENLQVHSSQQALQNALRTLWKTKDHNALSLLLALSFLILLCGILIKKFNFDTAFVFILMAGESAGTIFAIKQISFLYKEGIAARILFKLLENATTTDEKKKAIDSIYELIKKH